MNVLPNGHEIDVESSDLSKGFKVIYYLMRLTQSDMIKVITTIICVRHSAIDEALNKCDKLSNENNYIMSYLLRGG